MDPWAPRSGKSLKALVDYFLERTQKDSSRRRTRANTVSRLEATLCTYFNARRAEHDRLARDIARYQRSRRDPENALHRSLDELYWQSAAPPTEAAHADEVNDEEIQLVDARSEYTDVDGGVISSDSDEERVEAQMSPRAATGPVRVKTEPVDGRAAVSLTREAYPLDMPRPPPLP